MEQIHAAGEGRQVEITSEAEYKKAAERAKHEERVAKREMTKNKVAGGFAAGVQGLMKWVGYLGIALMAAQMIWSGIQFLRDLDEDAKKAREETKKLTEALGTLNEELERMKTIRGEAILGAAESLEQAGNAFQSVDIAKKLREYNKEVDKGLSRKTHKEFKELGKSLEYMSPQFADLAKELEAGNEISDTSIKKYTQMSNAMIDASQASKMLEENTKSLNAALTKAVGKYGKLPYQDLQKNITSQLDIYNRMIGGLKGETNSITGGAREFDTGLAGQVAQRSGELTGLPNAAEIAALQRTANTSVITDMQQSDEYKELNWFMKAMATSGAANIAQHGVSASDFKDSEAGEAKAKLEDFAQRLGVTKEELLRPASVDDKGRAVDSGLDKALKRATAQQREWASELEIAVKKKSHLVELEKDIAVYVAKGMKNQKTALEISRATVESKLRGVSSAEKEIQNTLKTRAIQLKAEQAHERHLAAKANLHNVEAGIEDQILEAQRSMADLNEEEGRDRALSVEQLDELVEIKKRLRDDTNLELKAAKASIGFTEEEWEIAKLSTSLSVIQVASANSLLRIKRDLVDVERSITIEKQKQALEDARRSATGFNTVAGEYADKKAKVGGMQTVLDAEITKRTALEEALKREFGVSNDAFTQTTQLPGEEGSVSTDIAAFKGIGEGKVDFSALTAFKDDGTLTQKQKDFNDQLKAYQQLANQIAIDGQKITEQTNAYSGEEAMKALELETDKMKMWEKRVYTMNPIENAYQEIRQQYLKEGIELEDESNKNLRDRARAVAETQANLKVEQELMNGISSTIENGFVSMFQSLVDGSKSFKDSMKDLAKSVLADLAAMYLKAAALKFMMAFMPGGGSVMKFLGNPSGSGRYGGELTGPGYATGGIANGPNSGYQATLHGREAVVPLGNDRSIPVDIRGASGNTVNVSISMQGGQSQTSASGGGDMQALGRSIGGLVQQHLQTEMRPGGLLNRQGAKGRGG